MKQHVIIEKRRLEIQTALDAEKSQAERNKMGQFATPGELAKDILEFAATLLPEGKVRFLDPAVGTGAFYGALLNAFDKGRLATARGYEIDAHYGVPAKSLWERTGLDYRLEDFTRAEVETKFNLVICNPPYVRHHHINGDDKGRLQAEAIRACGSKIGGLAGLYCYFLGLSHQWLAKGALSGWLIPSEFMDVNYGRSVKEYLLHRVTLLRIHRFDPNDVQFEDALVSSAVVWFKNEPPPKGHEVEFTFGGNLTRPKVTKFVSAIALADEGKWTRFPKAKVRTRSTAPTLSDYFKINRGLATGDNRYFILSEEEVRTRDLPLQCFRPILPSPRHVAVDEIHADAGGVPLLDRRLFLLDTRLPEEEISQRFPSLHAYLQEGRERRMHEGYLCSHRKPWYSQENRAAPPILCTYLGRSDNKAGRPFRFILNRSKATIANVYLALYPTPLLGRALAARPELLEEVWRLLNAIPSETLLGEGRVYGGGLHKLEPRELANVPVPELAKLVPLSGSQAELFSVAAE